MAIDLDNEQFMPLSRVPQWLANRGICGPNGKMLSLSLIYAWVASGRLEVVRIGKLYTTAKAIASMASSASEQVVLKRRPRKQRVSKDVEERHQRDLAELRARGFKI